MDEAKPMAEVTQADRDRVWPLRMWVCASDPSREKWDSGWFDSAPLMQSYAAHRIAHQSRPLGVEREDLARAVDPEVFEPGRNFDDEVTRNIRRRAARETADRILTLTDASDEGREAVRREAFEEAALIADAAADGAKRKEEFYLNSAEQQTSTSGKEVDLESAIGFAKRASLGRSIAAAIRAVPPSDSSGDSA